MQRSKYAVSHYTVTVCVLERFKYAATHYNSHCYVFQGFKYAATHYNSHCLCFQGFKYAATQYSTYCFCGNSGYDRYGAATNCDMECPVDSLLSEFCGGASANQVYEASKDPYVLCVTGIHLTV